MKMEPFFSIIIPTYNRVELMKNAIQSVLLQTFTDWEVIMIDDGSTDNTFEVIDNLNDSRIHYIYQENSERSTARNKGISLCKGKFICFLDSDDAYFPHHLESLHSLISKHDGADAMYISNVIRNEFGKLVDVPFEKVSDFPNAVCYILTAKENVIPPRVAISRSILKSLNFDQTLKVSEDTDLWVRIASQYPLFQTEEKTVIYVLHENNSTVFSNNPFRDQLNAFRKIFRDPKLKKLIPLTVRKEKLSRCYHRMADFHYFKKDYLHSIIDLAVSVFYNPFTETTKSRLLMMGSATANYLLYRISGFQTVKNIPS